jgi:bifunctional non-homologous end joining protein LigD
MEGRQPKCGEIFTTARKHKKTGKRDVIDYLVCNNAATLLYIINLGCIDVNPWTSRASNDTHPDFIIIDLDPSDKDFNKALEAARASKELFNQYKLKAFAKTSGKTGMHLFIPCSGYTFPQARTIAENISGAVHEMIPSITTTEVTVQDRGTKLYLDPNQNDYADTVASAYSVRPFKYPMVSTPVEWKEVQSGLDPTAFNVKTIPERIETRGDLFLDVLSKTIATKNDKVLKAFL